MAWLDSRTLFVSASLFFLPLLVVCAVLCLPILAFATVGLYLSAWTIYLLQAQTDAKFNIPYNPSRVIKINIAFLGLITGWISDLPLIVTYLHWRYWVVRNDFHKFVSREITYSDAHPSCRLDVYKPKHRDQLSPIIVFIYGGSWSSGNKYLYTPLANTLRELGYIVAVPDYRKYPLVKVDAMYDDVRRAIKWAFEHGREYGGDPNAIYVMGHSAGAHLSAHVIFKDVIAKARYTVTGSLNVKENLSHAKHNPTDGVSATRMVMRHLASQKASTDGVSYDFLPQIEGLLLLAGVYSIEKHLQHETHRGVEKVSAMSRVMGGTKHGYEANSPLDLVRANEELFGSAESITEFLPRIMFIHGEKDTIVPMEQSIDMYNMLGQVLPPERRDDVDVSMRLYKRMNHGQCVTALMPNFIKRDRMYKSLVRDFKDFIIDVAAAPEQQ